MLSNDDRRTLAEIERSLEEDRVLRRAFDGATDRSLRWVRRVWFTLLMTCLVSMVGTAALHLVGAAVESAALAVAAGVAVRVTSARAGGRARRRSGPPRST